MNLVLYNNISYIKQIEINKVIAKATRRIVQRRVEYPEILSRRSRYLGRIRSLDIPEVLEELTDEDFYGPKSDMIGQDKKDEEDDLTDEEVERLLAEMRLKDNEELYDEDEDFTKIFKDDGEDPDFEIKAYPTWTPMPEIALKRNCKSQVTLKNKIKEGENKFLSSNTEIGDAVAPLITEGEEIIFKPYVLKKRKELDVFKIAKALTKKKREKYIKQGMTQQIHLTLGRNGVEKGFLECLESHFKRHRVLSIRIIKHWRDEVEEITKKLEEESKGVVLYRLGRRVVLYRPREITEYLQQIQLQSMQTNDQ